MLIASIALLVSVLGARDSGRTVVTATTTTTTTTGAASTGRAGGGGGGAEGPGGVSKTVGWSGAGGGGSKKRFTLRLGQGFRFADGVVVAKSDDRPDVVFKYVPPQVGGMALRYNTVSRQLETGLEPTLTSPAPLLLSTHINSFEEQPNVARITSGDIAEYQNQATVGPKTRYVLLMNAAGDQYVLTLDEMEAVPGKYDDWRIGFAYEQVHLPVGLAGGRINRPLPGKMVFRDWYRVKMILRVDLTSGKEEAIADGNLPSVVGNRLLGYGDSSGAYVIRDSAAGKILHTVRFNEQFMGPVLSPDGTRLLGTVHREGPGTDIGNVVVRGAAVLSTGVFDLTGREIASFRGYDDATWTPDGKIIATGALNDPGLFELDPATKAVRAIDAQVATPFGPSVSPDGKTIALVTGGKVWLIDRDGKNLRQLLADGRQQQRPVFSPDGTKVAMIVCNQVLNDVTGEVFVVDLKTQEVTPLRTSAGAALVPDTSTRLNWVP
jgi:hypothetical protein